MEAILNHIKTLPAKDQYNVILAKEVDILRMNLSEQKSYAARLEKRIQELEKLPDLTSKLLDEVEARFDRKGRFDSIEFAEDYLKAAKHMLQYGRINNRIRYAEDYLDLPY